MNISIHSASAEELLSIWKRVESHYDLVDSVQFDHGSLDYKLVITKPTQAKLKPILKLLAAKIVDWDRVMNIESVLKDISYHQFLTRIEEMIAGNLNYPELSRLVNVWPHLSAAEKRSFYLYLRQELLNIEEGC